MAEYSVAESKNQLPRLIDRMLTGEPVTITRRGRPIARIVPVDQPTKPQCRIDLDWLDAIRERTRTSIEPVDTVRQMRDGDRY